MSAGPSEIDSEFAAQYSVVLLQHFFSVAPAALLLYDTAITFGQDLNFVWRRGISVATFLFMTNRILGIMYGVGLILIIPSLPQLPDCAGVTIYFMVMDTSLCLVWASFSALRVYAIGGLAWRTATVVWLLAVVSFGINLFVYSSTRFSESYVLGFLCTGTTGISTRALNILEVVMRASLIASDAIVLFVTWRRTYDVSKRAKTMDDKTSLAGRLWRDGTLFFAAGITFNAIQLGTFVKVEGRIASSIDFSYFITSASCMITSRFFLSLRQYSEIELNQNATGTVTSRSLQFSPRTIATIGADLDM